jgi:acyl carrier protein
MSKFATMEKTEILSRVKQVVSDVLKLEDSEITDDANFVFDLGADSMQSVELVAGFEEEFDIEMDQDKALEVQNIDDAVIFISEYL